MAKLNIQDMYKSMVGWAEYKTGDEKHDPTHKLISFEDWERIIDHVNSLNEKIKDKDQKLFNKEKEIDGIRTEYAEKIAKINIKNTADITGLQEELLRQKNLNDNLLRIAKERANAKRGLQPKKKHTGYRYIGKISQIKVIKEHTKKGNTYESAWTFALETPYDATIPLNQVKDRIHDDLLESGGICNMMHLNAFITENSDGKKEIGVGEYKDAAEYLKGREQMNFIYDIKYINNPKSRLWEIQIYTTGAIESKTELL